MVFLVTVSISAQAFRLTPVDVVTGISGGSSTETRMAEMCTCRITAETAASADIREETTLPAALDARTALMEWGEVWVEKWEPDLGGVKVNGIINVETLISSGVEGHPAAAVRNTIDFEQLVEVPEWLAGDVCAEAALTRLDTRVEQGGEREDSLLVIEAGISVKVTSMGRECINVVEDAYATEGARIELIAEENRLCTDIRCVRCTEQVKGTLLLNENAPGVGNVISVSVHPNVSAWNGDADGLIEGILEATVLYMPGGSDRVASARSEMPFSVKCPGGLNEESMVCIRVLSAEASTLMSDRVELKCNLGVSAFSRDEKDAAIVGGINEGDALAKRPGIILVWPDGTDTLWSVAKRYSMPVETIRQMNGGSDTMTPGKAVMIRI